MKNVHQRFAVSIGLDWANKKHDVCIQIGDQSDRLFDVIGSTPEAIEAWIQSLHKCHDG